MAAALRRRQAEDFDIHEDVPSTQDTEMVTDGAGEEAEDEEGYADQEEQAEEEQDVELEQEQEQEELEDEDEDDMSEEEVLDDDMKKLQEAYPGFKHKYRLIKRIGEGVSRSICLCLCLCLYPIHHPPSTIHSPPTCPCL